MPDTLVVILEGRPIGRFERTPRGLRLTYDADYLDSPEATVLSAAMSPPIVVHTDAVVTPWLWGLLPDSDAVLARWGRELGVSVSSPFALLSTAIGHDCAGAVQLCAPEDVVALVDRPGEVEPLSVAQVAERLRALKADATTWLGPGFTGQFSLAGAQAKTALARGDDGDWGQPRGSAPTTHILKPAVQGLDGHDLNEHLCLAAAGRCGLRVATTWVEAFEEQTAIVVERYDRRIVDGRLVRIHQEDLCQALAVHPARKYQAEGGPGPAHVATLLRSIIPGSAAEVAVWAFVDALAFNWLIAGTDAHAKNYSLLHSGSQARLAPLYDVASALPYDTSKGHKLKLAMRIGREYRLLATDRRSSWDALAAEVGLDTDAVVGRVVDLAERLGPALVSVAGDPMIEALGSDLPARLVETVTRRAASCASLLS